VFLITLSTNNSFFYRCCSYCVIQDSEIVDATRNSTDYPLRDPNSFKSQARIMGRDPTNLNAWQREFGKEWGVNRFSELWEWPGVSVCHVLTNDFMHCEVQGESQKHFLKV
jgi:hypothetical protein